VRHRRHKAGHDTMPFRPRGDGRMDQKRARAGLFLGGVTVGVLLLITWLVVTPYFFTSGTNQPGLSRELPSRTPFGQHRSSPDQMQRCTDAATALKSPLRRASASVAQWEIHVGAMNQLVSGAITLPQATAFWNRTRVGALQRVQQFERAWTRLQRQGVNCPRPARLTSQSVPKLRSCAEEVHTDMQVLRAARTAIGTWRRHVRAMNMLRMGKLAPSKATRMWVAMWPRGQHEINMYRVAARVARVVSGSGCPASAT
jgi:hypothetical protein